MGGQGSAEHRMQHASGQQAVICTLTLDVLSAQSATLLPDFVSPSPAEALS